MKQGHVVSYQADSIVCVALPRAFVGESEAVEDFPFFRADDARADVCDLLAYRVAKGKDGGVGGKFEEGGTERSREPGEEAREDGAGVGGAAVPLSQTAGPMLLSVRLHCCHGKICESVALCSRSHPQPLPPSNPPFLTPLCLMAQQRMDLLKWSEPVK